MHRQPLISHLRKQIKQQKDKVTTATAMFCTQAGHSWVPWVIMVSEKSLQIQYYMSCDKAL